MKNYIISFIRTYHKDGIYYLIDSKPLTIFSKDKNLKFLFKNLKKFFNETILDLEKTNFNNIENIRFGMTITIIDFEKEKIRNKKYEINPNNLKKYK